jgi:hypothetical protein
MSGIAGLMGRESGDEAFLNTIGQNIVYTASQEYVTRIDSDLMAAMGIFVQEDTENYTERYKLPGGGRMQKRNQKGSGGAVRPYGGWDVAYPLEDFDEQLSTDDVELAYMTLAEYQRHLDTIQIRYINAVRYEMFLKLFKNTNTTFVDPRKGSLTIVPLANSDSVTYPPVLGSETEATESHYYGTNYAATAINDTNNPYATLRDEIEEHFGAGTGGENIVAFIHPDERPETELLTSFVEVPDNYVRTGSNVDVPQNLPNVPGRILGRCSGVWVVEYRYMPSGYILGLHLEAEPPLKRRVDPAVTGLPRGLALIANDDKYPLLSAHWRARFGFGVANRLNGVVLYLTASTSYTIPTAYQ